MSKKPFFLNKWDISKVYIVLLVVFDIFAINASSILAMMLRFNGTLNIVPEHYYQPIIANMPLNTLFTIGVFALFKLYRSVWRYVSTQETVIILIASAISSMANLGIYFVKGVFMYRSYFILYWVFLAGLVIFSRYAYRLMRYTYRAGKRAENKSNIMIVGAGDACYLAMHEIENSMKLNGKVRCIIDDDEKKHGTYIRRKRVVGGRDMIEAAVEKYDIDIIIIAMPSVGRKEVSEIVKICNRTNCDINILPGVYQLMKGDVQVQRIRTVQIEDLLGREVVDVKDEQVRNLIYNKVVLVTGGGGSIGSELCRQVAANEAKRLIIVDIYENSTYEIQRELATEYPELDLVVLIGSVRDEARMNHIFETYKPEIVFHAAAHKHVPLMEDSPNEAIKNNVFGTYDVCKAADKYRVKKFVLISTDKAVNPTNIMGASKRMCEMIVQTFNKKSNTEFVAVRFGNVLGSNGSVIPFFKKQIEKGGPVTVTDPNIIRYFMTIPEAVSLVLKAGSSAKGGEIFVLDMGEPVKIDDLARNLIKLSGLKPGEDIEIKYTGLRPGEKLYEELLMSEEGLTKTDNELIYIGKPISFNEAEFENELKELYEEAHNENRDVRLSVQRIVRTYQIKEELLSKLEEKEKKGAQNIVDISDHLEAQE